jgi:hypothetical protein
MKLRELFLFTFSFFIYLILTVFTYICIDTNTIEMDYTATRTGKILQMCLSLIMNTNITVFSSVT